MIRHRLARAAVAAFLVVGAALGLGACGDTGPDDGQQHDPGLVPSLYPNGWPGCTSCDGPAWSPPAPASGSGSSGGGMGYSTSPGSSGSAPISPSG